MSGPMPLWPLADITPITLKGWLRTRMICPVESTSGPNSVSFTVLPRTATLAALVTSCELKKEPYCVGHARIERQVDVGALDAGEPVLVAGDHLRLRLLSGGEVLRARDLAPDRVRVVLGQGARGADTAAHAARREVAGIHGDHVGAGALDLVFDHRLRAVAHRDERDHGRDADDHAEHGQARAHLVAAERLEGDAEGHDGGHGNVELLIADCMHC